MKGNCFQAILLQYIFIVHVKFTALLILLVLIGASLEQPVTFITIETIKHAFVE